MVTRMLNDVIAPPSLETYNSISLFIVDADLKSVATDVGPYGREDDAGIFLKINFGKDI